MLLTTVCRGLLISALLSLAFFSKCPPVTNLVVIEYRFLGHFTSYNPAKSEVPPPPTSPGRYNIYEIVSISNTDKNPNPQFNFSLKKIHIGPQGKGKNIVLDPAADFASQDFTHPPMPNGIKIYFQSPNAPPLFVPPGQKVHPGWKIVAFQSDKEADDHLFYEPEKSESVLMSRLTGSEPSNQNIGTLTEQNLPSRPQNLVNIKYRHLRTFSNYEIDAGSLPQPSWPNLYNVYELISIEAEPQAAQTFFNLSKVHSLTKMGATNNPDTDNPVVSPASFNPKWPDSMKVHFKDPLNEGSSIPMSSMTLNWKFIILCQQCAPDNVSKSDAVLNKTWLLFYDATGGENVIMTRVPEQEPNTKYINRGFLTSNNLP